MTTEAARGTVLVADDDEALRQMLARAVTGEGYAVRTVENGDEAVHAFDSQAFDLVLSDIDMPGRNGIELLRAVRERDLDIPFVLITGGPTLATAISAIELGASHYLTKPVDLAKLQSTIRRAMQAGSLARARRNLAAVAAGSALQIGDLAGLGTRFDAALSTVFMVCQPIVSWSSQSVFAYEALVRTTEPTIAVPDALFDAADRLGRLFDIGRRIRTICGGPIGADASRLLFVNLHPKDLMDDSLYERDAPLTKIAERVVLEITERARLEVVSDVAGRIARLRGMGFRIAIDDIGAGYAGLTSFAALEPNFMKLDRALITDIHQSKTKMSLVGAMIRACQDLGVHVIGEGIETTAERDALVGLECDLLQGYLFSRPERPFATPSF